MAVVNYTYGILTGGVVPNTSVWYRHCPDVEYTCNKQATIINRLWGSKRSTEAIGCGADLLIHMLQCSPEFSDYLKKYDPLNTYNDDLVVTDANILSDVIGFTDILNWADNIPHSDVRYPVLPAFTPMERITNALLCVLTMRG